MISIQKITTVFSLCLLLLFTGCNSSQSKEEAKATGAEQSQTDTLQITEAYKSGADTTGLTKLTGNLNYSGAEPFARPTLFVSDSVSYQLTGDSLFVHDTYSRINGKYATLYGVITDSLNYIFHVRYYKVPDLK